MLRQENYKKKNVKMEMKREGKELAFQVRTFSFLTVHIEIKSNQIKSNQIVKVSHHQGTKSE